MFFSKAIKPVTHNILIVEDEADISLLLDILLQSKNVKTTHVRNLYDAMIHLKHEEPSLMLLDNRLPDGYGVDFIQFVKANYPKIKILMISGVDHAAEDFALECGADSFLPKPFTKKEFHLSVDQLLN